MFLLFLFPPFGSAAEALRAGRIPLPLRELAAVGPEILLQKLAAVVAVIVAGAVVLDKYDITVDKAELFALRVDRGIERIIVGPQPFVLPFQCRDLFLQRRVLVLGLFQLLLLLRAVAPRLRGSAI